jgi:hypothetical protein
MHRQCFSIVCVGLLAGTAISLAGNTSPPLDDALHPPVASSSSAAVMSTDAAEAAPRAAAISGFLGDAVDTDELPAGQRWQAPVAAPSFGPGFGDARIGAPRTDALKGSLDFDAQTGHLFAAVLWGDNIWTVNISIDHGQTWTETYSWVIAGLNGDELRVRRFDVTTGLVDIGFGFHVLVTEAIGFSDVSAATNADDYDNRLYVSGIQNDNQIRWFWNVLDTVFFESSPVGISADRSLDMHWNESFSTWYLYLSYLGTDGNVHVLRRQSGAWDADMTVATDAAFFADVAVSAHDETVIVGYEFPGTNAQGIKYQISYNSGDSWNYGVLADPPVGSSGCLKVHLTARGGIGTAVIHGEEVGQPDPLWFVRRAGYSPGGWTTPQAVADHDLYTGTPMVMNWIPPFAGRTWAYGGIYTAGETQAEGAYFLRVPSNCLADIIGPNLVPDGNVDALDFLRLIAQWGSPCTLPPCDADITGPNLVPDGNVDALDYLMLIAQWGSPGNCPPSP